MSFFLFSVSFLHFSVSFYFFCFFFICFCLFTSLFCSFCPFLCLLFVSVSFVRFCLFHSFLFVASLFLFNEQYSYFVHLFTFVHVWNLVVAYLKQPIMRRLCLIACATGPWSSTNYVIKTVALFKCVPTNVQFEKPWLPSFISNFRLCFDSTSFQADLDSFSSNLSICYYSLNFVYFFRKVVEKKIIFFCSINSSR